MRPWIDPAHDSSHGFFISVPHNAALARNWLPSCANSSAWKFKQGNNRAASTATKTNGTIMGGPQETPLPMHG